MWAALATVVALAGCGRGEQASEADAVAHGEGMQVTGAWSREIPPNAPVAAGFVRIANHGGSDDRLVAVRSDAAERVEIHEVRHEDGMARMRELADGLPLPAGATVELKPGGYHLMFITPDDGFVAGNRVQATLVFAETGELDIELEVRPVGATHAPPAQGHPHH